MDGREEAGAQVVVEVLVLAHLKHFLPLLHGHLILHTLCTLVFLAQLLPSKLHKMNIQHINSIFKTQPCSPKACTISYTKMVEVNIHGFGGNPWRTLSLVLLTLGFVGATLFARKASL